MKAHDITDRSDRWTEKQQYRKKDVTLLNVLLPVVGVATGSTAIQAGIQQN